MAKVYLSIGSNIDREQHIRGCLDALAQRFGPLEISSVFESAAVGFSGAPFYNLVVGIETELDPAALNQRLRAIEEADGRRRDGAKFSGRTLDIDILLHGDRQGEFAGLRLPRPEITENAYVLWPLAELCPTRILPGSDQSIAMLWAGYDRDSQPLHPVDFSWRGRAISPRSAS